MESLTVRLNDVVGVWGHERSETSQTNQDRDGMDTIITMMDDFNYYGVHWSDGVAVATNTGVLPGSTGALREWASGPTFLVGTIVNITVTFITRSG